MTQLEEPRAKKPRLHRVPWLWPLSSGLCCWGWYICWACGGLCGRWGRWRCSGHTRLFKAFDARAGGVFPRPSFLVSVWCPAGSKIAVHSSPYREGKIVYRHCVTTHTGAYQVGSGGIPPYDKHMDENVYRGFDAYGTTGLLNDPEAVESTVAAVGTGGSTKWADKTKEQILADINAAITAAWAAAEYDESAMPNHILLPYEQYGHILTTMVTDLAAESILDYLLKNNVASKNGGSLFIGATRWCKGAGTGGTDRMAVYVNHERFLKMDELVPLGRVMSGPNVANVCYDTAYMANISQVQLLYPQTMTYWDGV